MSAMKCAREPLTASTGALPGVEPPPNPKPSRPATAVPFQAVKGKYRKPGTGCVTQINDHLWEGRYSPKVNGKRMARNIYAPTEAECEEKLATLITEMKQELALLRAKKPASLEKATLQIKYSWRVALVSIFNLNRFSEGILYNGTGLIQLAWVKINTGTRISVSVHIPRHRIV